MVLLALYILLAIAVSFLCSIMEAVLLSVTPGYLASIERAGQPVAAKLRQYKEDIDEPLAAILSLNTIAHTIGAAGAGAQAAKVFGDQWIGAFSAVLTLAILFFSEIIPKTIGARYWKQLTGPVIRLLALLMIPLKPFVYLSGFVSRAFSGGHHSQHVSREELSALADLGAEQGVLDPKESRILRALMRFRSLMARDIMTPRTVIFGLPADMTAGAVVDLDAPLRFSRIPIYSGSLDELSGYVLKDQLLETVARDSHTVPLSQLAREIIVVQGRTPVSELLERFLTSREHVAAVVDEYGGTSGLVTLEDVVETLLDLEIVDEADKIEDLAGAARADWRKRAQKLGILDEHGEPITTRPPVPMPPAGPDDGDR